MNYNREPRTFVCGDIHGAYLALRQVLERSEFIYDYDTLITIGDVVDGWGDSFEVVEELLKIENRIDIIGNHDNWFKKFIETGKHEVNWKYGGLATAKSYAKAAGFELSVHNSHLDGEDSYFINLNSGDIPDSHQRFFRRQVNYYKDYNKNLFVHGGFNKYIELNQTPQYVFMWDRHLWHQSIEAHQKGEKLPYTEDFNDIFIGHTATSGKPLYTDEPVHVDKVWNVDTGAGGWGKLTIMDIETKEYFQSDSVPSLYPDDEHNLNNK